MENFLFSSKRHDWSNGFQQEEFSTRGTSALNVAARKADTIILIGARDEAVPISYGWHSVSSEMTDEDGDITQLPRFAVADHNATGFLTFADDFMLVSDTEIGLMQLIQIPFMDLDVGATWRIREEILVSKNNDVASITDHFFTDQPVLSGTVNNSQAVFHLQTAQGHPVSHMRVATDGSFSVKAPAGDYILQVLAPALEPLEIPVFLGKSGLILPEITLPEPARIILPQHEVMRLVFKGIGSTPDPDFDNTLTGFSVTDEEQTYTEAAVNSVYFAGAGGDLKTVDIPAGQYHIYATKGIEYSITQTEITVEEGEQFFLQIAIPERAISSPGFIAADLHVHSGQSFDNSFPVEKRVRTFVAEHGEVMVAAEHETLFDFAPVIARMGLVDKMVSVIGTEATGEIASKAVPNTIGHVNFFPLKIRPNAFKRGAPLNEGRRIRDVLADVHSRDPQAVSQ